MRTTSPKQTVLRREYTASEESVWTPERAPAESVGKRWADIVLALVGLLILSPIMAVIAVAIKLEDGGSILFFHPREGYRGRRFDVIKFRSMVEDHDLGPQKQHPDGSLVTSVGSVLRRTGLDEAPQLINVLLGDMSLIGPRPINKWGYDMDITSIPGYVARDYARPGIGGLAQLKSSRDDPFHVRFRYDRQYVDSWSLTRDLELVVRCTIRSLRGGW